MARIAVLGDGGWGTALALLLNANDHVVRLWGAFPQYADEMAKTRENRKFLPGVTIPDDVWVTSNPAEAVDGESYIVLAAPAQFVRPICHKLAMHYHPRVPIISVAKGIENETNLRPSQVISQILAPAWVAVLSGPCHAEEVARGMPTIVAAAAAKASNANEVQQLFMSQCFRAYSNTDVTGVELGGALKNVIGLAAGMCDGLGLGDNAKSALVTRGLAEISRLGAALGARRGTFSGLSGLGDLITTSFSPFGRNRWAGEQIGKGIPARAVLASTEKVIEGIHTVRSVHSLADEHNVPMPISEEVYNVIFRHKDPATAVDDLMQRLPRSEQE